MNNDLLYQVALTLVPGIGDVHAKALAGIFGNATDIFKAKRKDLEAGIGAIRAKSIKSFDNFSRCETELEFIEKYRITPLFITDKNYPQRLLNCYDSPALLYYRGTADLNQPKIVSIVGTRNNNEYGKAMTEKLLEELAAEKILVVSGLAFGIDTIAHRTALKQQLETVGVLAHGLDIIYPSQNKALAKQMTAQGGLLTDFMSNNKPDKQNFPKRNRIVAGMCDALIVMESSSKGGSLITAELANSYNKDVFAFPGKATDSKSEGCNQLIKQNKALMITSCDDLIQNMGWKPQKTIVKKQRELFIELSPEEKVIVDILQQADAVPIDELSFKSKLSSGTVANALLMLEMQGLVVCSPGKMYRMV